MLLSKGSSGAGLRVLDRGAADMACAPARAKTRGGLEEEGLNPNPFPMSRIP